jgi:tetratricopeptide (TPR) repeat protein
MDPSGIDEFGRSRRSPAPFHPSPPPYPLPMETGPMTSKGEVPFDSETHMRKATETDRRLLTAKELQSCDQNERALDLYTSCIEEFEELECFLHDKPMSVGVLPEQVFAARYNRGLVYRALGRYDDAVLDVQKALSLPSKRISDEDRLKARFARCLVHFECHEIENAMEDIDFIVHTDPTHAGALLIRAMMHHMEGRMEEAVEECTTALSLPQNKLNPAFIHILRGDSYKFWPGYHQQESLEDYEKAMDLCPNLADRFIGRGFRWPEEHDGCVGQVKQQGTTTFHFIEELLSESDYLNHPILQMSEYRPPPPPPTKDPLEMETVGAYAVMETMVYGDDDEDGMDIGSRGVGASDKENRRARSGSLLTADILSLHNRRRSFQRRETTESTTGMSPLEKFASSQSGRVDRRGTVDRPSFSRSMADDVAQLPWHQSVDREYRQPWKEKHSILQKETSQIEVCKP